MAFQNVIDALSSTIHRDTVSNPLVEQIGIPFRESLETFPYQLSPRAIRFLTDCGIEVTNFGHQVHPHPFHKSVEIHLLSKVWKNFSGSDNGVMFMKEKKFKKIQDKNKSFKSVWNYKFTGKDSVRFDSFKLSPPDNKFLFMHDAIMYFKPEQILGLFSTCKNLERLFASLVVPPESDFCDQSLYPSLYKFKRDRDKLIYQPEGHAAGSYTQPLNAIQWLKISKIEGPDFSLKISVLESWGPIHNLMIEKASAIGDEDYDILTFKTPDATMLPNPVSVNQPERDRLVPSKVYNACFSYVRSVRTLRETDPAGFVRTQFGKEEYDWVTPSAWDNLQSFILKTCKDKPKMNYILYRSPLAAFLSKMVVHSEKGSWILAASLSCLGSYLINFLNNLSRSDVKQCSFFWKWIIEPKRKWYQIAKKIAPFFSIKSEVKRKDLLGMRSLRPLCDEYPGIFNRFQSQKKSSLGNWLSVAAFALPLCVQGWRWISGKYAPQQLDQMYQSYFHPKPWSLELKRKPVRVSKQRFFPAEVQEDQDFPKQEYDDRFFPHPDVIENAEEKLEVNTESEEPSESTEELAEETREETQNEVQEHGQAEEIVQQPAESQQEVSQSREIGEMEQKADETEIIDDSEDDEKQVPQVTEDKESFFSGASASLSLRKISDINCGVKKYILSNVDLDFRSYETAKLSGRDAIFFSKDNMMYGHDKIVYKNSGWPKDVAKVANFLSDHFKTDFNSALVNIYENGSMIPWHSDDEMCYDDASPILTFNMHGEGFFMTSHSKGINCNREILIAGDLLEMPIGFQSTHKHSVDSTTNDRVSVTFRHQNFSIPKYEGKVFNVPTAKKKPTSVKRKVQFKIPAQKVKVSHQKKEERRESVDSSGCMPEQPENEDENSFERSRLLSDTSAIGPVVTLRERLRQNFLPNTAEFLVRERNGNASPPAKPKQACLLEAFGKRLMVSEDELWGALSKILPNCLLENEEIERQGLNTEHLTVLCAIYQVKVALHTAEGIHFFGLDIKEDEKLIHINHSPERGNFPGHFFAGGRVLQRKSKKVGSSGDLCHAILRFSMGGFLLPIRKVHDYQSDIKRAKNLISNMKNGFDGVMANVEPLYPSRARDKFLSLDLIMDQAQSRTVKLIHIAGFAGCGKSYPIQELMKTAAFRSHKVAVPTVELRGEWKDAMNYPDAEKWRVSTWESSMLKNARTLVIDEIYKMPRGYLDLAIHADLSIEAVIVLGDPIQGEYHSTNPSSNNKVLSPESEHLRPFMDYYCLWSRRIPRNVAEFFNVPTTNSFAGIKKKVRAPPSDMPILCNAVVTAKTLADTGYYSTTIASSQGSTYDSAACILLDRFSSMLSRQLSLVALTRSRRGVYFCGDDRKLKKDASSNPMFSDFWAGSSGDVTEIFQKELSEMNILRAPISNRKEIFSGKGSKRTEKRREMREKRKNIVLRDSISVKKTPKNLKVDPNSPSDVIVDRGEVIIGDGLLNAPQISTHFLPETRRPLHYDFASALPSDPKPMEVSFSPCPGTHVYPGENFENLAALINPAHDPELKEIIFKDVRSNQFPLLNVKFELGALPSSLLAAIHKSNQDETLLPASVEKRLRFRPSENPYELTAKDELLGTLLFTSLCKAYRRNPNATIPFDEELFAECINANEYAQLSSKTQATIAANASRSDPDWRYTVVRIFSKTQHKINENTLFGDWKACQTLALLHDAVVLLLGPVKKYQRIFDKKDRPSTLYIHAGHTPFEMSEWCKSNLTKSEHVSNDYTAFDQSQHGEAVVLEIKKMQRLNIPENLIELHSWLKTNVQTQFGPLTCMRLTGEPGTYDDNTDYNIAVLHSEYIIGDIATMVSGDDSMLDKEPPPNPIWPYIAPLLSLTFKKEKNFYALFCGYYVGVQGACRSPLTLFAKLCVAFDDESMSDKRLSYLTEFAVGHSLGEEMWQLFPEDQVMYQSANFDFFCRYCNREEKLLLKLGEPDEEFLNTLFAVAKYISRPVFALLKSSVRKMYMKKRKVNTANYEKDTEQSLAILSDLSFG